MQLRVMLEPQEGATYDQQATIAQLAEELGFDGFFRSDHYAAIYGPELPGYVAERGPTDALTALAGLARDTTRIRLGTMVCSATFRHPSVLAITAATVDAMSGGRLELGLGTGWFAREHEAYGIEFPSTGQRFDRLEEQLAVLHGLWTTPVGKTFDYHGEHYRLSASPALPKPVQSPHPPMIIGGAGPTRTPRLAATYADEYNVPFQSVEATGAAYDRARAACEAADRDPASLVLSASQTIAVGANEDDVRRRAAATGSSVEEARSDGLGGTVAEVVDKLGRLADVGVTRAYLQMLDLDDLDHLRLIADEVLPQVS